MRKVSRREFLARTAQLGAAVPLLASCDANGPAFGNGGERPDEQPLTALAPFAFTDSQRSALTAAVARMIPAEGAGDWSAADAGAVEYIEQLLNAFSGDGNPKLYGGGPTRDRFAQFHALPRAKIIGWQREVLRLRELYGAGLDELNRLARGPLSLVPGAFATLPAPAQDTILESLDLQAAPFFAALFEHTMEGVYGHPVYGGNENFVGWQSVCYPGDVHGVRFPGGQDATADARPWQKFGGYAPEEMIAPGECAGGGGTP